MWIEPLSNSITDQEMFDWLQFLAKEILEFADRSVASSDSYIAHGRVNHEEAAEYKGKIKLPRRYYGQ